MVVNSEEEANWLSIQRKRQIGCKFGERVNEPPVTIHPSSFSKKERKKVLSLPLPSFLFFRDSVLSKAPKYSNCSRV